MASSRASGVPEAASWRVSRVSSGRCLGMKALRPLGRHDTAHAVDYHNLRTGFAPASVAARHDRAPQLGLSEGAAQRPLALDRRERGRRICVGERLQLGAHVLIQLAGPDEVVTVGCDQMVDSLRHLFAIAARATRVQTLNRRPYISLRRYPNCDHPPCQACAAVRSSRRGRP